MLFVSVCVLPAIDLFPVEGLFILIGPDAQVLHPQSDIISAPPAERFTEQHLMTGVGTEPMVQ